MAAGESITRSIHIEINVASAVSREIAEFNQTVADKNLEKIISRYPVRETPMLTEIARKLGFQNRNQYESAVRRLLMDDIPSLDFVKLQFDTLAVDIMNA